ncbi:hypothetical protein FEZ33_00505 [Ruoffia tabacinasalis]|uniref:Uncharacterized protein n=1 Tax=Ruoffia tabacinasalis TaxID=87458 RepID=A0A5R9EGZ5_9LACT|nr:hypothetical protein [Ruoffia tabacinasalis]TLQ49502.1 hypothetical protein FEZ33_00505 [Ruoffia tabacinasalis]
MKTRKHLLLSDNTWEILDDIQLKIGSKSYREVIEYLVENYKEVSTVNNISNVVGNYVASQVKQQFEEYETTMNDRFNILRLRTGYASKHTQIILDMMNNYILKHDLDNGVDDVPALISNAPTNVYNQSLKKYDEQMKHFQMNAQNKKQKEEEKLNE